MIIWRNSRIMLSKGNSGTKRSTTRKKLVAKQWAVQLIEKLSFISSGRLRRWSIFRRVVIVLELLIDLRLDLRNGLFPLEELDRLAENLREAEALSEATR